MSEATITAQWGPTTGRNPRGRQRKKIKINLEHWLKGGNKICFKSFLFYRQVDEVDVPKLRNNWLVIFPEIKDISKKLYFSINFWNIYPLVSTVFLNLFTLWEFHLHIHLKQILTTMNDSATSSLIIAKHTMV